jgi:hypothetical protein
MHARPFQFWLGLEQKHLNEVVFHEAGAGQKTQVCPLAKKSALHRHL